MRGIKVSFFLLTVIILVSVPAYGTVVASYTGTFSQDDDIVTIPFDIVWAGPVTITTFGYAGGTNGQGDTIPDGGFRPIISVFDPTDLLIGMNDGDFTCSVVNADPTTGACWDAYLQFPLLTPGTYTLALTQYDNYPNGLQTIDVTLDQSRSGKYRNASFGITPACRKM